MTITNERKVSKTIWIGKKAYFYLDAEERKQRGCKPLTKEQTNSHWKRIKNSPRFKNGQYRVENGSFGGGDGTYNGRWWEWSVDTVCTMLDEGGFKYRVGKTIDEECISISI